MDEPNRPEWSIDPDLDGIDVDPDDAVSSLPLKSVPAGDLFEAERAGDRDRLRLLLDAGANVNARDRWDSSALYYACLAGHVEAARMLLEAGAICAERTFDGDRCHYAALNLRVRRLLKAFEARPPPLGPLPGALRDTFLGCLANRRSFLEQCEETGVAAWGAGQVLDEMHLRCVSSFLFLFYFVCLIVVDKVESFWLIKLVPFWCLDTGY